MQATAAPKVDGRESDEPRVVRLPQTGRWFTAGLVVLAAVVFLHSVFTNPNYQWNVVASYIASGTILSGLVMTLQLTMVSMFIGTVIGIALALMQLSDNHVLRSASSAYVWFFRGVPLLVQLVFVYNIAALYPNLTLWVPGPGSVDVNVNDWLTPFLVAIIAFSLHEAAYMSEIIRSGILSVDRGQTEAAAALGMQPGKITRRIVLPQAMRVILPPSGNQFISLLKGTSLVSVIAVPDLLYSAQMIYARSFETIPLLLVAAIWYLTVTTVLTVVQRIVERRYSRGFSRTVTTAARRPYPPAVRALQYFRHRSAIRTKDEAK